MSTVFGMIIEGKIPSKKVFENERILAIEDIHPVAPVHILIMPKKQIPSLHSLEAADFPLLGEIVQVAQKIAEEKGVADGYRLITNSGPDAGQTIFHLHFHLIGGKVLGHMA
ncbi:MAG: histidine triad nucleotide-binding protein [Chlamydiae bacterium CG10_big_fil_rev_8_21_14_0_10_42_34]|nr:MAG: histidine triad nucleotide-binding protein [Chlamydiae bacterium CG10_big_fil_rev_8_21_14_0_10_42_34]